jgi:hypothetical protein
MKAKNLLAIFALLLVLSIGARGQAQPNEKEKEILVAFRDAVNSVLYPDEVGDITDLFGYEVEGKILPKAPEIVSRTIALVYERIGEDVDTEGVLEALHPNVAEVLLPKKEDIEAEVREMQKN